MNPLIKLFQELHPNGTEYILRDEMPEDEFATKMERIHEAVMNATEEERNEFLDWNQNRPPAKERL